MKAVVLLSGGLDSTTALFWAKKRGYGLSALSIDYGQRHRRELDAAREAAKRAGAEFHEIKLALPWLKVSSLINKGLALPDLPLPKIGRELPSTYVPGRNTVFLSLALSLADAVGAQAIVIGANALDYSGYPDCRPRYLAAFEKAARLGSRSGSAGREFEVLAPLIRLDKKGIIKLALKVNAPLALTWSCYRGGQRPCGKCDSCKLRAKGFYEVGVADPALS
ncbi:MAG: 7-cyano-7-deazaguanine synthase QueC [Elusimicrobia bacterium]|nr:7-cyano-7-deazaguanine synthase QueC [Elusimicrobiota bacterium]